jgi:hypothetical protein
LHLQKTGHWISILNKQINIINDWLTQGACRTIFIFFFVDNLIGLNKCCPKDKGFEFNIHTKFKKTLSFSLLFGQCAYYLFLLFLRSFLILFQIFFLLQQVQLLSNNRIKFNNSFCKICLANIWWRLEHIIEKLQLFSTK